MATTEMLAAIDEEIARLKQVRSLLVGHGTGSRIKAGGGRSIGNGVVGRRKYVLSPEARKRIADAQKKRWAKAKKKRS
jgi:hypothetical protein